MLAESLVTDVILAALSTGGDFAEVFMEDTRGMNLRMLNGSVEEGISGRDYEVGIRLGINAVASKGNKKEGVESIGNASRPSFKSPIGISPTNFFIEPGTMAFDELVEKMAMASSSLMYKVSIPERTPFLVTFP